VPDRAEPKTNGGLGRPWAMNISITDTFFWLKRITLNPQAAFQRRNLTTVSVDVPDYEGYQNLTNT
jgi:hypothetical protein